MLLGWYILVIVRFPSPVLLSPVYSMGEWLATEARIPGAWAEPIVEEDRSRFRIALLDQQESVENLYVPRE